ncbi:hypothetical protein PTKIN_Ptkin01aG0038100 [Pterospermum kingtungense]
MKIAIVICIFVACFEVVKPQVSPSLPPLISSPSLAPLIPSLSPSLPPLIPSPSLAPLTPSPSLAPLIPSPSLASCSTIIYDMADCLSFISNGNKEEKPTPSCCTSFIAVLKANDECICEALKSSAELGIDVNLTKAATLPFACQVSAPPISECDVSSSPGTAPAPANPPFIGAPTPTTPPEAPDVRGSLYSPSPSPAPSAGSDEVGKLAPQPMSGTNSQSACFFVLISMLVISVSYM